MSQSTHPIHQSKRPRTVRILAENIHRELRDDSLREKDVMSLADELLDLVTDDAKKGTDDRE